MPMNTKEELSNWLGEDTIEFIMRRHDEGKTYREIATELSKSGYLVTAQNIMTWVAYSRKKQRVEQP